MLGRAILRLACGVLLLQWLSIASSSDWSLTPQPRLDLGTLTHDAPENWLN